LNQCKSLLNAPAELFKWTSLDNSIKSAKSDPHDGNAGYDAGKRIKGRIRNLFGDTLRLLLEVEITKASVSDRKGIRFSCIES
jgi:hypothetical protein